jgi:hypothetical protein
MLVLAILMVFAVLLVAVGLTVRMVRRLTRRSTFDPLEWLEDFSANAYRPMERLLDNRDYTFLAAQAGFEPSIARRLRRERVGVFHSYLGAMIRDFHRLLLAARVISVFASDDQSAFIATLWRVRWSFYASVAAVEIHVALHWMGVGTVDVRGLVASMQRMELDTMRLLPA